MASANPLQEPEDLTHCGICNETITDPKTLPCLHTFCLDCLQEWSRREKETISGTITCPVLSCKKITLIPDDGVDNFPGNVFVTSLIEIRY